MTCIGGMESTNGLGNPGGGGQKKGKGKKSSTKKARGVDRGALTRDTDEDYDEESSWEKKTRKKKGKGGPWDKMTRPLGGMSTVNEKVGQKKKRNKKGGGDNKQVVSKIYTKENKNIGGVDRSKRDKTSNACVKGIWKWEQGKKAKKKRGWFLGKADPREKTGGVRNENRRQANAGGGGGPQGNRETANENTRVIISNGRSEGQRGGHRRGPRKITCWQKAVGLKEVGRKKRVYSKTKSNRT